MTNLPGRSAAHLARLLAVARRRATPTVVLGVSAVLVLVGIISVLADRPRPALVAVLLLQGGLALLLVLQRADARQLEDRLAQRIDQANARQLADLARTRHALLTADDARGTTR